MNEDVTALKPARPPSQRDLGQPRKPLQWNLSFPMQR